MTSSMEQIVGKPPRVRKLEFLIHYYREMQSKNSMDRDEFWRYELMIQGFRNEYIALTGKIYQEHRRENRWEA